MNPMVRKELNLRMRERRGWILPSLYLVILAAVITLAYYLTALEGRGFEVRQVQGSEVGIAMFLTAAYAQMGILLLLAPIFSAGALTIEKEQRTMAGLLTSLLSPFQIWWGKFAASLLFVLLLIVSGLPMLSVSFAFGGIGPWEVFMATITTVIALGSLSAILPVLNGIHHIATLVHRFGSDRVLGGVALVRAELSPEGDILRSEGSNLDKTSFGELTGERSARCQEIQHALAAGGVSSTVSDNIVGEMWAKFCAFAANATISTLTRARAGEIAAAPAGPTFVDGVFSECASVATAEGYPPPKEMGDLVRAIYARAGSSYAPSILSDMEKARSTEGEFTIGDLVRRADRHGLSVPVLRAALCNLQIHDAQTSKQAVVGQPRVKPAAEG